jgi:hypothetical protein
MGCTIVPPLVCTAKSTEQLITLAPSGKSIPRKKMSDQLDFVDVLNNNR